MRLLWNSVGECSQIFLMYTQESLNNAFLSFKSRSVTFFFYCSTRRFWWILWIDCSMLPSPWIADTSRVIQWAWPSLDRFFGVIEWGGAEWDIWRNEGSVHMTWWSQGETECSILMWWRELFTLALCICMRDHAPPLFQKKKKTSKLTYV